MDAKKADPALEADSQVLILDYLLYETTSRLLSELNERVTFGRRADVGRAGRMLDILNPFMKLFKASRHPQSQISDDLDLRFKLWKFTTLFSRRLERDTTTPTRDQIRALRDAERDKAMSQVSTEDPHSGSMIEDQLHSAIPEKAIQECCKSYLGHVYWSSGYVKQEIVTESMVSFTSSQDANPLIGLMDQFMVLSALCSEGMDLTHEWIQLAADFMLQAVLEECLCRGADVRNTANIAFRSRWRCDSDDEDEDLVSEMLSDRGSASEKRENPEWTAVVQDRKDKVLAALTQSGSVQEHLEQLLDANPIVDFERRIAAYLTRISEMTLVPVLKSIQSEDGAGRVSTAAIQNMLRQRNEMLKNQHTPE